MTLRGRPLVCLVTSRRRLSPDARTVSAEVAALDGWLDEAIGLVDVIQIREPDLDAKRLTGLVRGVAARAAGGPTAVVVNDRADVALAAGAAGVHGRAAGPPTGRYRAVGPPGWLVGRSVHTPDEVASERDADYVIFGAVFPSPSKQPQGLERLGAVARVAKVPLLAIGGIDAAAAARCYEAGAAGVAAIGLFLPPGRTPGALGISQAVAALRHARAEK